MTGIVTLYATFPDADTARAIARTLIDERLVACVNIGATVDSLYRWEGRIEDARETPALLKTRADKADAVIARIAALHPFAVPCIVAWPVVSGHQDYLDWVAQESRAGPQ